MVENCRTSYIRTLKGQTWVPVSWKWLYYLVKGYLNSWFILGLSELFIVKMSPPRYFLRLYILTLTSALLVSLKRLACSFFNKRTWWISKFPVMSHEPCLCIGRIRLELHVHVICRTNRLVKEDYYHSFLTNEWRNCPFHRTILHCHSYTMNYLPLQML